LPVPPGFVLLTDAYRLFVERAGIQAEIERIARAVDADDQQALDAASASIRSLFDQGAVPPEVAAAIAEAYTARVRRQKGVAAAAYLGLLLRRFRHPAWTPLFLTAGALVTETGGMMSHGSVVAREYGIPAVVGVPEATTLLRTGDRVRVDGSTGTVVPLDDRGEPLTSPGAEAGSPSPPATPGR
jgi:phosphoenolpyruvate synthase/pyruvate phosphate dikinase